MTVAWYWGKSERGKTHAAYHEYPKAYRKIASNKWWDSYQGENEVIIDDFDKAHHYMGYNLKIWGDRYCFQAEVKGSSIYIRPKVIIVTSNYHPSMIWEDPSTLEPILRRFKIVHFCWDYETPVRFADTDEVRCRPRLTDAPPQVPPPAGLASNFNPPSTPQWLHDILS